MSEGPAQDPRDDGGPGSSSPSGDGEPDERAVRGDGSGGALAGSGDDDESDRQGVAAEESVDEVFEDLSTVTTTDGGGLSRGDPDRTVVEVPGQRPEDGLFDDRGGHKRVVGDSDVDELFDRYVEESPEDVMDANDPALESPTEAELRSLGDDGPLGKLPDPPDDAGRAGGVGAFVGDSPRQLKRTGEDTHRTVGESDVDAVFEEFEEDSVEEVIETDELAPEDDEMVQSDVDPGVEALFQDLSSVDLEERPVPEVDEDGPAPAPAPSETAGAVEGLMSDLPGLDPGSDADTPDAERTATVIENMLSDLSGSSETPDAGDPGSRSTRGSGGSPGRSAVGEPTVADAVVDVSATDLFRAFHGSRRVEIATDLPRAGWADGPEATDGVSAAAMFDGLGDRVDAVPEATAPEPTGDGSAGGDPVDGTAPTTEPGGGVEAPDAGSVEEASPGSGEASPGDAPAADDPWSKDHGVDADVEVPEIDLESPTGGDAAPTDGPDRTTVGADATGDPADRDVEVPEIDLESPTDGDAPTAEEEAPTADPIGERASEDRSDGGAGDADVPGTEPGSPPTDGGDPPDEAGSAANQRTATRERGSKTMAESGDHTTGAASTENGTGDDVDDLFDGYEEDTPEEIVVSAEGRPGESAPDDAIVGDVEGLFADLSTVDLEPEGAAGSPGGSTASADRAPDSEEAVEEIEEMFSNLESVDVEPREVDPAETDAPERADVELSTEAEDAGIVGESDVDAVFEEFEEETVEEVIRVDEGPAEPEEPTSAPGSDDEPAEVETGSFMKELAAGKDPEEIGITLYDGSQTDDGGAAIAASPSADGSVESTDDAPSIESAGTEHARSEEGPSIEAPETTPARSEEGPSIESAGTEHARSEEAPSIEAPETGAARSGEGSSLAAPGSSETSTSDGDRSDETGSTGETPDETGSTGETPDEGGPASTEELFREMTDGDDDGDGDGDPWSTVTDTEPVAESATEAGGTPDATAGERAAADGPATSGGSSVDAGFEDDRVGGRSRSGSESGEAARFTATDDGPGSETLFPAEDGGAGARNDDGTVIGAFKLLIERIGDRLRNLF